MKTDFEIPLDIKNDLVYCHRALTNHILIHQKLSTCANMTKPPDPRVLKSLKLLEKEIIDIGNEQKLLFNRLRFFLDYHQLTKNVRLAERERLNKMVGDDLLKYAANTGDIKPKDVLTRLSEDALYAKYLRNEETPDDSSSYRDNSSGNSVSDEMKIEPISDEEPMEIQSQPEDLRFDQKTYAGPRQKAPIQSTGQSLLKPISGPSLLKPMNQRKIEQCDQDTSFPMVVRPEIGIKRIEVIEEPKPVQQPVPQQSVQQQSASISLSRLRLAAALCKAKDASKVQTTQIRVQTKSPEIVTRAAPVKSNASSSSSRSSNASCEEVEMISEEEATPQINAINELGQEAFLRMFGLFTPAYTTYLLNRRPQRKKRLCTSTERVDFHYGKFELFEKQFANKRNKRQFLYSPPATRAKRRIGSNGTNAYPREPVIIPKKNRGIKSNASSSSSISSNGSNGVSDRVCLTCYKRNNLLQCQECCGKYHAGCHASYTDALIRKSFCPFCVRQKSNGKLRTYSIVA